MSNGLLRPGSHAAFSQTSGMGHLCRECLEHYRTGKLCATCQEPWNMDEALMIKCDGPSCRLWTHAACELIDEDAYQTIADGTHPVFGFEFLCAAGCAVKVASRVVTKLTELDEVELFARPVDATIAPTYRDVIKNPMDLSTMRTKAENGSYRSTQMIRNDAELMCANAVTFNRPGDRYWREACRFFDAATKLFEAIDAGRTSSSEPAQPDVPPQKSKEPDHYSRQFQTSRRRTSSPPLVLPSNQPGEPDGPAAATECSFDGTAMRDQEMAMDVDEEVKKEPRRRKSVPSDHAQTISTLREAHYNKVAKEKASRNEAVRKDALAGTAVKRVERVDRVPCLDPASCVAVAEVGLDEASASLVHSWLDVCLVCGSGEAVGVSDSTYEYDGPPGGELLACVDCGEVFHAFCVFAPSASMDSAAKLTWRCPNCKVCELCGLCKEEDESRLVYCDLCDKGYHLDCVEPPLDAAPPGRWICGLCVSCRYCDESDQVSLRPRWSSRRDCCASCLDLSRRCAALEACLDSSNGASAPSQMCTYCAARFHDDCAHVFLRPSGDADERACLRCVTQGDALPTHIGAGSDAWRCVVACAKAQRKRFNAKRYGSTASSERMRRPLLRGWTNFFESWTTPRARELKDAIRDAFGCDWSDSRTCALCKQRGDCVDAGRLVPIPGDKNSWVHLNCARWSSEVFEVDRSMVRVRNAVVRSRTLRCSKCNLPGATMGCCAQSCRTNYHFRCGALDGAVCVDGVRVLCARCYAKREGSEGVAVNGNSPVMHEDASIGKSKDDVDEHSRHKAVLEESTLPTASLTAMETAQDTATADATTANASHFDSGQLDASELGDKAELATGATSMHADDFEDDVEDYDDEEQTARDDHAANRMTRVSDHVGDLAASMVVPSQLDFESAGCKHDAYEYFVKRRAREVMEASTAAAGDSASSGVKKKPTIKKPRAAIKGDVDQQPSDEAFTPEHVRWLDNRVLRARELGGVFRVGALVIHDLGRIAHFGYPFHSQDRIYPLGYRATRIFWSATRPATRVVYVCEIVDGAADDKTNDCRIASELSHFPFFRVTALDDPDTVYSSPLRPRRAVAKLHRAVARCNQAVFTQRKDGGHYSPRHHFRSYGLGDDGAGFFGLSIPAVRARVEDLQNAVAASLAIKPLYSVAGFSRLLKTEDEELDDVSDARGVDLSCDQALQSTVSRIGRSKVNHQSAAVPIKQERPPVHHLQAILQHAAQSRPDLHRLQQNQLGPVQLPAGEQPQPPRLPAVFPPFNAVSQGLAVPQGFSPLLGAGGAPRLTLSMDASMATGDQPRCPTGFGVAPMVPPFPPPVMGIPGLPSALPPPHMLNGVPFPLAPMAGRGALTPSLMHASSNQLAVQTMSLPHFTACPTMIDASNSVASGAPMTSRKRPSPTSSADADRASKRPLSAPKPAASRQSSKSTRRTSSAKYSFCYVQPSVSDVLGAQRQIALRDAAVRPNPSGCARAEPRDKTDEADRARVTRSLVRAANDPKSDEIAIAAQSQTKVAGDGTLTSSTSPFSGVITALRENRDKYRRMKAVPMNERLEVRRSHIHGWGLFLKRDVRKDEFIVEYVGQIVRRIVGDKREKYYDEAGFGSCYLFRLDNDRIVDATRRGNVGRFINHCCKPNAYARVVTVEPNVKKIVIIALVDLRAGDEVMYDYKFPIEDDKVRCFCGAPNCRGFMN